MRTLLPDELKEQPLVKMAVGFTLIVMLGFVVTGFLLYFQHMNLSPSSVVSYYSGSEQDYRPAPSVESMLGVTHAHTIAMGAALLLLSFLLIRSSLSSGTKKAFIILPFTSAILNEAASWLVRSGAPVFGWVKVLSFLTLQISLVGVILLLLIATFRPVRRAVEPSLTQRQPTASPPQRGGQRQAGPRQGVPRQGGPQQGGSQQGGPRRRRRRPRRRPGGERPAGQTPPQGPPPTA